jgi:TRAP-type C4-dicarboxylate transport system substrate-binding protein
MFAKIMRIGYRLILFLAVPALLPVGPPPAAAQTVIKVALITPEGSTWTNALYALADEVKTRTNGAVVFQIYAGGVSGDETDVLRKMRVNRLHAAGFSGVGLGFLDPEIRILEAPLLYRSYAEVDWIKDRLYDRFATGLEAGGYILLGFAEAGFVYFFATEKMSGPDGFDPLKMWVWEGDPVAQTTLEALGIHAVPLHVSDVNTGLETGMINAFYSPPLAATHFQWYAKVRYMLDYPMVNSTGAFVIKKDIFMQLAPEHRRILRESSRRFCDELIQLSRQENAEARQVLAQSGIVFEQPSADQLARFKEQAGVIYAANIGRLYPRELFDRVQTLLQEYRRANGN